MKRNPEAGKQWHDVRQPAYQGLGANTLWHGNCDHHILGTAAPGMKMRLSPGSLIHAL
jgi:hypothetical protein